eukprot:COSAG02_NODE_1295_length_13400_cov_5.691828_22_plen_194_part_00
MQRRGQAPGPAAGRCCAVVLCPRRCGAGLLGWVGRRCADWMRGRSAGCVLAALGALAVLAAVSEGGGGVGSAGEEVDPGPPPPPPPHGKKSNRAGRKVTDEVLQVREWLVKMKDNKGDAAVQTQGCEKLAEIAAGSDEALAEVAFRGVSRIVAGMRVHPGNEQLQEAGCWVRVQLRPMCSQAAPPVCAGRVGR